MTDQKLANEISRSTGAATLNLGTPVVAGSVGSFQLQFQAGEAGIAIGGGFRIYTDSDSDWGIAQFVDPSAAEYCTVQSPQGVSTAVRTTGVKSLRIAVAGRALKPGEIITLSFGDTSGGGPGTRAQTFVEEQRFFWVDVDAVGDENWQTLDDSPSLQIIADEVLKLCVTIPSMTVVDEEYRVLLKAEDRWGNPVESFRGTVNFLCDGITFPADSVTFSEADAGSCWIEGFKSERIGVLRLSATVVDSPVQGRSNPQVCTKNAGEHTLKWADPHGGQLVLNSKISGFFRYARDVSGVQFVGYQRNADVISAVDWEAQQREEIAFYEPGVFVPIPGYEWSGKTWEGGHHNVYFRRHGLPVKRNLAVEEMFQSDRASAELSHIKDVYTAYRNTDTVITPHVGGEHSDLNHHDPSLEPAVEVSSSHGSFEWMIDDVLRRGYQLGFLGSSDCYTGRPGDDRPGYQERRYAKSGLTGIFTKDVSLESFFEAMRAKRVYATTGARIVVSLDVDGYSMGDSYTISDAPTLAVAVAGTAPLETLELFRGTELAYSHPLEIKHSSKRVRIRFTGSSRMTSYSGIIWDGNARFQNANIADVKTVRFDSPRSHITESDTSSVSWHAWGCGYPMGVIVELEEGFDPAETNLQISLGSQTLTGPLYGKHGDRYPRRLSQAKAEQGHLQLSLADIGDGPVELELGLLDRKLMVDWAPETGPAMADFVVRETDPQPGINAYWIKVTQTDGEMAWTSPVYADYAEPLGEKTEKVEVEIETNPNG